MGKLENELKAKMVKSIKAAGGYARRVEDQYAVGILDLILAMPDTGTVLAEAKRFTGEFFEPSPRQFEEMKRIDNGGGVALLIGVKNTDDKIHYLHGTNRDDERRGRAFVNDCIVQRPDETFADVFVRWYNEVIKEL